MKHIIFLVGQGPDSSTKLKTVSYAPYALKSYLDTFLSKNIKNKIFTRVIDFDWDMSISSMATYILNDNPAIIGFSTYLWNYNNFIEVAKVIKKENQNILIVFGGPQVSPIAKEVLCNNPHIDIIPFYSHFGETIFLSIVENYEKRSYQNVPGIYCRNEHNKVIKTSNNVVPIDYDITPSPYNLKDNLKNNIFNGIYDYNAVIETSRGCPFDCGYCFWGHENRKTEYFPLVRVLRDVDILYNNPKIKYVYFADANFLSSSSRAKTILNKILSIKGNTQTFFEIDFLTVTEPVAELLNKLPNFEYLIAVQTTNQNALKTIGKKRPSFNLYGRRLRKLKKLIPNMKYRIDVMLGLPNDDLDGYIDTLDCVLSLEPQYICLNYPVYLLPGTRFFDNKDSWGIRYINKPPYAIIETPLFPKSEIEKALKLSLWVQILTYYYPAIATFFYSLAKDDGIRIQRIMRWVNEIEKNKDFITPLGVLSDVAVKSVKDWNILKKKILQETTNPETSLIIYNSILNMEHSVTTKAGNNEIKLGVKVFSHLVKNKLDAVNFDIFRELPLAKIVEKNGDTETIRVLSIFK